MIYVIRHKDSGKYVSAYDKESFECARKWTTLAGAKSRVGQYWPNDEEYEIVEATWAVYWPVPWSGHGWLTKPQSPYNWEGMRRHAYRFSSASEARKFVDERWGHPTDGNYPRVVRLMKVVK